MTDNRVVFTAESSTAEIAFVLGPDEAVGINFIGLRRAIELASDGRGSYAAVADMGAGGIVRIRAQHGR